MNVFFYVRTCVLVCLFAFVCLCGVYFCCAFVHAYMRATPCMYKCLRVCVFVCVCVRVCVCVCAVSYTHLTLPTMAVV